MNSKLMTGFTGTIIGTAVGMLLMPQLDRNQEKE